MKCLYEAMLDPEFFGRSFAGPTFAAWRMVAKILDGLPLDERELALYRQITGRQVPPTKPFREAYLIKPRRAGGTLFAATLGLHAALQDYRDRLGRGEVATVAMIASDRRQARQLMNYVDGLIADSPVIAAEVSGRTQETITFAHRVNLEVHTTSFRSTRGYSYAAVILDEMAFFRDDLSANPDVELVRAVRPGLANLNGRLLGLSSPHSRRGYLFAVWQQHYGKPSDVLVIQAGGPTLNPTISTAVIERARAEDPTAARSEWDAQFREDITAYLTDELIEAAMPGRLKRGPRLSSVAFVDMSGGVTDAAALGVAHSETVEGTPQVLLDHLEVVEAPHQPAVAAERFAKTLRGFGLNRVTGDRYSAGWVVGAFEMHGIHYEVSSLDKSSIYTEVLPLFSERRVEIQDDQRLVTELRLLERKPRAGGRPDNVDHPPRAHDDAANAACGALWLAMRELPDTVRPDALIKPELLLTGGAAPGAPAVAEQLFAVVSANDRGDVGTLYFATGLGQSAALYVLDWSLEQLQPSSAWIRAVFHRLSLFRAVSHLTTSAAMDSIWFDSSSALAATLMHIGKDGDWNCYDAVRDLAGGVALPDLTSRAAAALRFVGSGEVKICRQAFDKRMAYRNVVKNHLLSQLGGFGLEQEETGSVELLAAFSLGVVLARRDAGDGGHEEVAQPAAPLPPPPQPGVMLAAGKHTVQWHQIATGAPWRDDGHDKAMVRVEIEGERGATKWYPLPRWGCYLVDQKVTHVLDLTRGAIRVP